MEKARILIVEDEAIIAMELESQIQSLGYEVTSIVDTGEKAITKAEEDKPDLILMDIRIKGEMDGIDAAEEIRNRFGIPVIFSTAYLDEERIERAKITMPFGYVLKPIQERDLKVTLEMALYVSRVDAERRKSEEVLERIFNLTPDPICTAGADGYFKQLNTAWEEILGYTKEELFSKPLLEFIHPDDRQETIDEIGKQIAGKATLSFKNRYRCKDGSYKLFDWNATPSVDGMLYATARDITKRTQAEKELKESEERFRIAIKNSSVIVSQVDLDLRYTWVYNPYPDFDPETVIGKRDDELAQNEGIDSLMQLKQQVIDTGVGSRKNIEIPLSDRLHIYDVKVEPLKDKQGKIIGATTASTDITDLHKE